MPLAPGDRVGPYEILAPLGAGGMGEVYRARDPKLKREVALKLLPEHFTTDPDRLARFQREAEVLASLNHPNIAQIHGLEDAGTMRALVMELVEGEDLAERIGRGALPLDDALPIARQIAEALEAAHEQGIIHRDLKPANIKVRADGTVKVLDFGLAKALESGASTYAAASSGVGAVLANSPTITSPALTMHGMLLGTAAYMSPEQAKGRPADKRSDTWAFGCVLYEMVTGRRAFDGEDVSETLAAVLMKEPAWTKVPDRVRAVLRQCLEKDPARRLRNPADAMLLAFQPAAAGDVAARSTPRAVLWAAVTAALVAAAVLAMALVSSRRSPEPPRPLIRVDVDVGADLSAPVGSLILSPDGSRMAFIARSRLYTRRLDERDAMELPGTAGANSPFFSPDGQWIAFRGAGGLRRVSVEGGSALPFESAKSTSIFTGGSWGDDDAIVMPLQTQGALFRIISDRPPEALTTLAPDELSHRWPQVLPGSNAVLFTTVRRLGGAASASVDVFRFGETAHSTLQRGAVFGRYLPVSGTDGYLLYGNRGSIFAVPFSLTTLRTTGAAGLLADNVGFGTEVLSPVVFAVANNGTLVIRRGAASSQLHWIDAGGGAQPLAGINGAWPVLSPDGNRLALVADNDVWVHDLTRDSSLRLTFDGGGRASTGLVWSPDGRYLVYAADGGTAWVRADGGTPPQVFIDKGSPPASFSPDGSRLLLRANPTGGASDIFVVPTTITDSGIQAGAVEPFLASAASELGATFSPDGRFIAYSSNESGPYQVYVRAFPDTGSKWLVSTGNGYYPTWSKAGPELFYATEERQVMVLKYSTTGGVFRAERPRVWSDWPIEGLTTNRVFDVHPDGKRIIAIARPAGAAVQPASQVTFFFNVADELQRRFANPR